MRSLVGKQLPGQRGACPRCIVQGRLSSMMGSFRAQRPIQNPNRNMAGEDAADIIVTKATISPSH